MSELNNFLRDSNFNSNSAFTRVKFGVNKPVLETELNEAQKIEEDRHASLVRQMIPTGFLELKRRDFQGPGIVCNPNGILNSIAIAPAKLVVNGYEVKLEGKETVTVKEKVNGVEKSVSYDGYIIINLGEPPAAVYDWHDFVYLEMWFEELNSNSNVYKNGFVDGELIDNNLVDDRVQDETSRRIGLRYRIGVHRDARMSTWPNGFGYNDILNRAPIYARGPKNADLTHEDYIYAPASHALFKEEHFFKDFGLYVAGRPGNKTIKEDFGIAENYIYGVPLLGVKRRSSKAFANDISGSVLYDAANGVVVSDRPDGLFSNIIDEKDIIDLRRTVMLNQINTSKLLDNSFKQLITGNLATNKKSAIKRAQIGITPPDSGASIFHTRFDNSLQTEVGGMEEILTGTPEYHLSAAGYGVHLDGKFTVRYRISTFNRPEGAIEFFLKPYWDGGDENISQTIFSIVDLNDRKLMVFKKDKGYLTFEQYADGTANAVPNLTRNVNSNLIRNNEIYHIRLTWSSAKNETVIYVNGQAAANGNYVVSGLVGPHYLKIGAVETIPGYNDDFYGCVIDEMLVYSRIPSGFPSLTADMISGNATIYPSFNGILNGFQDNKHKQELITAANTSVNTNNFTMTAPYGMIISGDSIPKVYERATGLEYQGDWIDLNTSSATFRLASTPSGGIKFNGEVVWIQYTGIMQGGLGIKEVPNKILKAELSFKDLTVSDPNSPETLTDISFASSIDEKRQVQLINRSANGNATVETVHKGYDYSGYSFDNLENKKGKAFARTISYRCNSNGTKEFPLPAYLYGRKVTGVISCTCYDSSNNVTDKKLEYVYKNSSNQIVLVFTDHLVFSDYFIVEIALAGYAFEYETYTKSLISNMVKASTITITGDGSNRRFTVPGYKAISSTAIAPSQGGIVLAFLDIQVYEKATNTNKTVPFVLANKTLANPEYLIGEGTPFIEIQFVDVPPVGQVIEIPVLVTFQPTTEQLMSIWYDYTPYQGIMTSDQKQITRISDWKVFCTTLGSGGIVTNSIHEKSINNASNRLPGGQDYSYLLDGSDVEFVGEFSTSKKNKKLVIRKDFSDYIENDEYDNDFNVLDTDYVVNKFYGKNHQDAYLASSLTPIGFALQDTKTSSHKYLGATCLVTDEAGNVLLFVVGEIKRNATTESTIKATHGDLFKIEGLPIILPNMN
jgi:hypothetical protein